MQSPADKKLVTEIMPDNEPTSTLKREPVEVRFDRVNGDELKDSAPPDLSYLPLSLHRAGHPH